jgi:cation:H+ antiporter
MFFIIFLYYSFFAGSGETVQEANDADDAKPIWKSALFILGGLIMLYFGGELIVKNAVEIARSLQIEEEIIGLTIVAMAPPFLNLQHLLLLHTKEILI